MNGQVPNGVGGGGVTEGEKSGCGMYTVKRPYTLPTNVQLPSVMYAISPTSTINNGDILGGVGVNSVSNSTHDVQGCTSRGTLTANSKSSTSVHGSPSSEAMNKLEQKQLNILKQLKSLHDVISNIHQKSLIFKSEENEDAKRTASGTEIGTSVSDVGGSKQLTTKQNIDVVIHANPNEAPYSLLFFVNLFEQHYENAVVSVKSHVHSSFKGTVNMDALSIFNQEKDGANFRFTVIWKNVDLCTMIISPVEATYIFGEGNMARFLSRLLPNTNISLNYDCLNWESLVRVDSLLDVAFEENVIAIVEQELKNTKTDFLTGQATIADLVLYSSVAAKLVKGEKKAPASVKNWFRNIETAFGFHSCMNK